LLQDHYGNSDSFDSGVHTFGATGGGDGKSDGGGAYQKYTNGESAGDGAVYITAGSSGKISSAPLDHEAMYYSVAHLGSCVLEVNGQQLNIKFLRETGIVEDYFTINKGPSCSTGAACDDGKNCTVNEVYNSECQCIGELSSEPVENNQYLGTDELWEVNSNWSLGTIPSVCTAVSIPSDVTVRITGNTMIEIKSLDLGDGANVLLEDTSKIIVKE